MIKRTLYFENPAYLSIKNSQLIIKIPEVENNETFSGSLKKECTQNIPIEDIGVVVLDNNQITVTLGVLQALLDNNVAVVTCDRKRIPMGLVLPLSGNSVQNERFRTQLEALLPGSKNTVKMGIGVQQNREQEYSKNGNKNTVISINIINQGLHCIINKKQDCDGLKNKITYHYVSRDSQAS